MRKKFVSVVTFFVLLLNLSPANAITFGQEVLTGGAQYPYVVSIWHTESPQTPPSFTCTGTLIESTVVLTAAHCLMDQRGAPRKGAYFVKYGNNLLQEGALRDVTAIWASPQYSNSKSVADVGLLRLSYPATGVQVLPLLSSARDVNLRLRERLQGGKFGGSMKATGYSIMGGTHQKVDEILTILQQRSTSVVAVSETPVVVGPSAAPSAPQCKQNTQTRQTRRAPHRQHSPSTVADCD